MLELATLSNWEDINRISAQVAKMHASWRPDLFCHTDASYPRDLLEEMIRERQIFVATICGMVVGYTAFCIWRTNGAGCVPRKVMSIHDFCVDEPFRKQGIGRQMMEELRVLAKAFGCTDLEVTVYPQNDEAVAFYQKCGYTIKSIDMQRKV